MSGHIRQTFGNGTNAGTLAAVNERYGELRARRLAYPGAPAPEALIEGTLHASGVLKTLRVNGSEATKVVLEPPLLASLAESGEDREIVRLADLPLHVVDAVLMTEDRRFYSHVGVDPIRMFGAALENAKERRIAEGGSTITQQLVKNVYLSPERTYTRKLKEAVLARDIEQRFTKDEILWRYLNHIYFGSGAYGVAEAARTYFDKTLAELTPSEAALIAGLPKAPGKFSPHLNPERAEERRVYVLGRMRDVGFIDAATHDAQRAALHARAAAVLAGGHHSRRRAIMVRSSDCSAEPRWRAISLTTPLMTSTATISITPSAMLSAVRLEDR